MDLKRFLEESRMNKYVFSEIAGVGVKSCVKYINGKSLRANTIAQIEKAIVVGEKHEMIYPKYSENYRPFNQFDVCEHLRKVREFKETYQKLIAEEL